MNINLQYNKIQSLTNEYIWFLNNSSNLPGYQPEAYVYSPKPHVDLRNNLIISFDDKSIQQYGICSYSDYKTFIIKYLWIFNINLNPIQCSVINSQRLLTDTITLRVNESSLLLWSYFGGGYIYQSQCKYPSQYDGKSVINFANYDSKNGYTYCNNLSTTTVNVSPTTLVGISTKYSTTMLTTTHSTTISNTIATTTLIQSTKESTITLTTATSTTISNTIANYNTSTSTVFTASLSNTILNLLTTSTRPPIIESSSTF